jgi:DNA-binding NarL/FixJ family response regulator
VLLLDRDVRHGDALSVTRDLARACLATRVLMLCRGGDGVRSMDVVDVLRAGAYGYVQKDAQLETVVLGLVAARAGDGVITGSVARIAFDERVAPPTRVLAPELTPREREVLTLVGGGATTKQIARRLGIVEKTVRNHLSHIYEKLQLMDRSQVALYAVRKGLVEL